MCDRHGQRVAWAWFGFFGWRLGDEALTQIAMTGRVLCSETMRYRHPLPNGPQGLIFHGIKTRN